MKTALVLAGGSARGAYEVGVVKYILVDLARELGHDVAVDILCGTSAGAINACLLAARADEPRGRAEWLAERWRSLRLEELIRPSTRELLTMLGTLFGRKPQHKSGSHESRRGGLLDPSGIERIVREGIPFERIGEHLRTGRLSALTVTTTHVASGRTVVFVQRAEAGLPAWSHDPTMSARATAINAEHALASAAVPLIFPAVKIDGEFYCDGGLRQNVPLSPARRLGADRLVVVNPRYIGPAPASAEREYPGPLALLGKGLNALLLDRIDNDIDRLRRINAILEAGTRRFGPDFLRAVNEEVGPRSGLRPLRVVHIRASQDIGALAGEHVRDPAFARRVPGWVGRVLRRIGEGAGESDLLSYMLFDGVFAERLMELGRGDARARHDELCAFFAKD